jgi:endo-1,4-beta-D-glucanase Y
MVHISRHAWRRAGLGLVATGLISWALTACLGVPQDPGDSGGEAAATSGGAAGHAPLAGNAGLGGKPATGTGGIGGMMTLAQGGMASPVGGSAGAGTAGSPPATGGTGAGGTGMAGTGTGGMGPMLSRGPTPPSPTSKFPFPQNRQSQHCTYPIAYDNEDVKAVYTAWKNDLVTSDGAGGFRRVKRPAEPGLNVNSTVSEGIAYGLLIAVYMDDQPLFDDLWKYSLAHTWTYQGPGGGENVQTILMNWYILEDGNVASQANGGTDGWGAATDADEDMAWALIQADKQWGGQGSLSKSYYDYAKQMLGDIWRFEIDQGRLPKNGSGWGGDSNLNISYFAPSYYRVFASVSGEGRWGKEVVDYIYQVIGNNLNESNGNQTNGLVPAWSNSSGGPADGSGQVFHYQYDACRTPFRIGIDACGSHDQRAVDYVGKTSSFFAPKGAAGIVDGYELNGTPKPEFPDSHSGLSAAFIGPAAVGAMSSATNQAFLDEAWSLLKQNNLWCGGQYYDESWTMLSMLMLSGNFLDYTSL